MIPNLKEFVDPTQKNTYAEIIPTQRATTDKEQRSRGPKRMAQRGLLRGGESETSLER